MQANNKKQKFVELFEAMGASDFYKNLLRYADQRIEDGSYAVGVSPEIDLLNNYTHFLHLYRQEHKEVYRQLYIHFRRAANTVYRKMVRKKITNRSKKFFNLVK